MRNLDVRYELEFVIEGEYWRGWALGKRGDYRLRFNFHPMHRWRRGDMEIMVLHEVCGHFVHAASLAREIESQRINPFIGLTGCTTHIVS